MKQQIAIVKAIFLYLFSWGLFLLLLLLEPGWNIIKENLFGVGDFILTGIYFTSITSAIVVILIQDLQER